MTGMSRCAGLVAGVVLASVAVSGSPPADAEPLGRSYQPTPQTKLATSSRHAASLGTLVARTDVDGDRATDRVYLRPGTLTEEYERAWTLTVLTSRGRAASTRVVAEAGDSANVRDVWRGAAALDGRAGAELLISVPTVGDFPMYAVFSWRDGKLATQSIPRDRDWLTPRGPGTAEQLVATRAGQFVKTRYQISKGRWYGTQRVYRWSSTSWKLTSTRRVGPVSEAAAKRSAGWFVKGFARI